MKNGITMVTGSANADGETVCSVEDCAVGGDDDRGEHGLGDPKHLPESDTGQTGDGRRTEKVGVEELFDVLNLRNSRERSHVEILSKTSGRPASNTVKMRSDLGGALGENAKRIRA